MAIFIINDAGPLNKNGEIYEKNLLDTILKNESRLSDIKEYIKFDIVST